jgi:hypothetical protein
MPNRIGTRKGLHSGNDGSNSAAWANSPRRCRRRRPSDATAGDDTTMTSANAQDEADDGERESDHYGDDAPTALWCAYVIAKADR